ncbi:MAG: hypothetical protein HND58_10685 [Planctomycetota bacterium]|nr:MAG: hypothetical protein HND58_10685 [Planctomycetota bacterium]
MRMHPVISILLAAWFGLGSTLGPRFLCLCADGRVTVELGHQFCCDAEDSCCDSCDGVATVVDESCGDGVPAWTCPDGCESTLVSDGAVTTFDRADREQLSPFPKYATYPFHSSFETPDGTSRQGVKGRAQTPTLSATGTSQLRSVILLV